MQSMERTDPSLSMYIESTQESTQSHNQAINWQNELATDSIHWMLRFTILYLELEECQDATTQFRVVADKTNKLLIQNSKKLQHNFSLLLPTSMQLPFCQDPDELAPISSHLVRSLSWLLPDEAPKKLEPNTSFYHTKIIYEAIIKAIEHVKHNIPASPPQNTFCSNEMDKCKFLIKNALENGIGKISDIPFKLSSLTKKRQNKTFLSPLEHKELLLHDKLSDVWNANIMRMISDNIENKQAKALSSLLNKQFDVSKSIRATLKEQK